MTDLLRKLNPAVDKKWLNLVAGLMWSGVGGMLIAFATRWLKLDNWLTILLLVLAGLALGTAIYMYGFSKVASKNISRIAAIPGKRICIFAFQEWKTYPLVAFMILLGIYLRVYSPIPKPLLAILYLGLGTSLLASSLQYYWQAASDV
ncbi:MAG: hypothetical protein A2X25_00820 [Chloroflexi bacterium GWB2_49_20]|nr:MAG: hypothetical protein A2X25_00820 [Chloroflexi bacterium GWB2_49_20]OGN77546.1 MAG: hypothetical protein A2X26_02280 [Chloroflexi bacterium GWC2_49_37]OGN83191.1 MAG: hypothetical protein A2X27_13440 [Chloroflexi bacterium GWD2_49_16]